jgi:hypothetical protein
MSSNLIEKNLEDIYGSITFYKNCKNVEFDSGSELTLSKHIRHANLTKIMFL